MANLPDYVAMAKPNPLSNRAPWWTNTAQTLAGVMLWVGFWNAIPKSGNGAAAGLLSCGLGTAIAALVLAALLCHLLFYLIPGKLGMQTGHPLYIVGTSTYGVNGGFLMPGFLMGVLQFGWLAVNSWWAGILLTAPIMGCEASAEQVVKNYPAMFFGISIGWAVVAAFVGLKGIKYVAKIATFFPLIPLTILIVMFAKTAGGLGDFDASKIGVAAVAEPAAVEAPAETAPIASEATADEAAAEAVAVETAAPAEPAAEAVVVETAVAEPAAEAAAENAVAETAPEAVSEAAVVEAPAAPAAPLTTLAIFNLMGAYVLGFFATAGAAGCDMGTASRDAKDVRWGGLVGVFAATVFSGTMALAIYAGAYGSGLVGYEVPVKETTTLMNAIMGDQMGNVFNFLLAVAAFPAACFSSMIAANSFKTTLPKVNPFISCGLGTLAAIILILTQVAGDCEAVFGTIGASFGPICGAIAADYFLSGCKWNGPRAGFNPAGWISWFFGFFVGAYPFFQWLCPLLPQVAMPCPPLLAFLVGFGLYFILASVGLQSQTLEMETAVED
ncbi:MAG: hypothetical protein IJD43_08170 [Thermoguttaceae bacterium]|nr:hypothetical protein [Thermoguttaceae bacterium]